jgi:hypothetical protein
MKVCEQAASMGESMVEKKAVKRAASLETY